MKRYIRWMLALAAVSAVMHWNATLLAQSSDGVKEQRATLTIKPDGSCQFTSEVVQSRTVAEQQVRTWERYQKMSEAMGDEEEMKAATGAVAETKPLTDDELAAKIREMTKNRDEERAVESDEKVSVEATKDTVRTATAQSFATLEDMLKEGYRVWGQGGLSFQNVRFEKDTNAHLRVTLTPPANMQRYAKTQRQQLKMSGTKTEFRLVFPGKVLTSGFPETKDTATWIATDAQKDETLDAAMKLYDAPTVITTELAGLKLDQPLESKTLQRLARSGGDAADDLPITNAGPGFAAEPLSITTTTLHLFPDGEKYFKERSMSYLQRTGAVVSARLFAPKGRTLQSVSDVRILKATDDKGRVIAPEQEGDEMLGSSVYQGGSRDASSTQIQLRLQLPQPDAQAIDEISAQAVVVTAGTWKQVILTNIQENATNELDLAEALPGAKMVITKFSSKSGQLNIQAKITGPKTIRRLDVQARISGSERSNSNSSERNFSTKASQSTRTITIQDYSFGEERGASSGPMVLVVRYPEDLRRERVDFKLKGLDLF